MDEQKVPALLRHCYTAYSLLMEKAEPVELDENEEGTFFTGSVTSTIINGSGITTGNYSAVINRLKVMGCITQVTKGSGNTKSIIKLNFPPNYNKFLATQDSAKQRRTKDRALQQQFTDLSDRLTAVEAVNRKLIRQLELLESRVDWAINNPASGKMQEL